MSFIKPGARPKRREDRHSLLRTIPTSIVPPQFKKPPKVKGAAPEAILQGEVNDYLDATGTYYFRLSERLLAKGGDKSAGGWPDNPIIIRLIPGLSLLFPLELKKQGEGLRPNQLEMQERIGTVMADNWKDAEAYMVWARATAAYIEGLLRRFPPPVMPVQP